MAEDEGVEPSRRLPWLGVQTRLPTAERHLPLYLIQPANRRKVHRFRLIRHNPQIGSGVARLVALIIPAIGEPVAISVTSIRGRFRAIKVKPVAVAFRHLIHGDPPKIRTSHLKFRKLALYSK